MIAYEAIGSAGIEGYCITMSSDKEIVEFLEVGKYSRHLEKNRKYIINTYRSLNKLLDSNKEIKNIDELISYWRVILGNNLFHRNIHKVQVVVGSKNNIAHRAPNQEMFN